MKKMFTGRLEGVMRAETPICHSSGQTKGTGADTIDLAIKMSMFGAGGGGHLMQHAVSQGNGIRGIFRDIGAAIIAKQVDGFDKLDDFRLYFNGGSAKTTEQGGVRAGDIAHERAFRDRNPFVSLFGGQYKSILHGHLRVGFAVPITESSKHLIPDYLLQEGITPHADSPVGLSILTRRDDSSNPDFEAYMCDSAQLERDEELQRIFDSKKNGKSKSKSKETAEEPKEEETEEAKKAIQMIRRFETIAAGTNMFHSIEFFNASEEEIGLIIEILKVFSMQPYIGGRSASGFGRVGVKYHFIMETEKHDNALTANTNEGFVLTNEFLEKCHEKFLHWLKGYTRKMASVAGQDTTGAEEGQ